MILVWIHGFQGSRKSFGSLPQYFNQWKSIYFEHSSSNRQQHLNELEKLLGQQTESMVLCGHSMGGLLACDVLNKFPIVGLICFDTPFNGVNSQVLSQSASKHVQQVSTLFKQNYGWGLLGIGAGIMLYSSSSVVKSTVDQYLMKNTQKVQESIKFLNEFLKFDMRSKRMQFLKQHKIPRLLINVQCQTQQFVRPYDLPVEILNYEESDCIACHMNMFNPDFDGCCYVKLIGLVEGFLSTLKP